MKKKINDFGVKIDGARKDKREAKKEHPLPKMKGAENFLLISRDNIWPETNGEELIASGIPQGIAFWREQIRKAIPPNPANADERSMINYFNIVSELRDKANQVNDPADIDSFFHFLQQHYLANSDNQHVTIIDPAKDVLSQELLREAQTEYCTYERKAEKLFFGISKEDRAALRKKRQETKQNSGEHADSPDNKRRKPFPFRKFSSFIRNGPVYLPANHHAGKEEFLSLGIRSVEFGKWMSDENAQAALDQCYHALRDLAYILEIKASDISLGGNLALSFGARGHGEILADYQAEHQLISLPNGHGNGFLAHAWAYALDDYFEQSYGKSFSRMADLALWHPDIDSVPAFVKDFLHCIKHRSIIVTAEEQNILIHQKQQKDIQKCEKIFWEEIQSVMPKQLTPQQKIYWDNAVEEIYHNRYFAKLGMYSGNNEANPALEKLSAVHKEITGYSIPKRKRSSINYDLMLLYQTEQPHVLATEAIEQIESTDYQQGSSEMSRHFAKAAHGEYYSFPEQFARAFDCYIADKLQKAGIQNQFLTAHSEEFIVQNNNGKTVYAIPIGKEREQINQKFDELIQKLKELGLFHQKDSSEQTISNKNQDALNPYPTQSLPVLKGHESAKYGPDICHSKTSIAGIRDIVAKHRLESVSEGKSKASSYMR